MPVLLEITERAERSRRRPCLGDRGAVGRDEHGGVLVRPPHVPPVLEDLFGQGQRVVGCRTDPVIEVEDAEHELRGALTRLQELDIQLKDLQQGLVDFHHERDGRTVYLCWKLGEDRIRYYHRQDEGFAGRKPIDPRDPGPGDTVQ